MGLDSGFAKAKRAGLYVSAPYAGTATEPTDVTVTNDTSGGSDAGDTSMELDVSTGTVTLPKGTRLNFGGVQIITTAAVTITAGTAEATAVDAAYGQVGDGIPAAIANAATATWDQLYWVAGTESTDFNINPNSQTQNSVTYDAAEEATWDDAEILSASWALNRSGNRKADDGGGAQIRLLAHDPSQEIWVKRVLPREDGSIAESIEGRAGITTYSDTAPAPAIVTESYGLGGRGKPKRTIFAPS